MKKINVNAPVNQTGYGIASINILKALYNEPDLEVSLFPIGNAGVTDQEEFDILSKFVTNSEKADANSPAVKIWHQFDLFSRVGNKGKYYAYPFFELDTFSEREKHHLKCPDTIFATSEWAKSVLLNNIGDIDVRVVPLGVDSNIFNPNKYNTTSSDKYVFLNIGKWEIRKGHDVLLKLFTNAFPNNENVELWILAPEHTNSYSDAQELIRWKNMYSKDSRIKVFTGFRHHEEVAQLINNADCGIFPSRAEGWNLELLECMAMNKPVITTYYSSHTEYCNDNNAFLVRTNEIEKAFDGKAFNGQGNWAKLTEENLDNFVDHMRYVYTNQIRQNNEGLITSSKYNWTNTAKHILGCIH